MQTVRGVFTVVTFFRGVHAMFGHFREGQGFAAYSREARLRDPLPLGVFDTFPRLTFTCYVCTNTQHGVGLAWLIFIGLFGFPNLARLG